MCVGHGEEISNDMLGKRTSHSPREQTEAGWVYIFPESPQFNERKYIIVMLKHLTKATQRRKGFFWFTV